MGPLRERVEKTIDRRRLLKGVSRVGAAVSGGADSIALLELLREICPDRGLELRAYHLNHRLRGEASDADERFVQEVAERLEVPLEVRSVDVAALAEESGWNLEDAGRRARYQFFGERIADGTVDVVATGHHLDDQAETVLFRVLRGGGSSAPAGIRDRREPGIVRPLLDLDRAELRAYLRERSIEWREDLSNQDPRWARNRIRRDLLPQLERDWNPNLSRALARNARIAADEEDYWSAETERLLKHLVRDAGGDWFLDVRELRDLHPAVERRLWRALAARVRGDLSGFDADHVERLRGLVRRQEGAGAAELPGLVAERSFDTVRVSACANGQLPVEDRAEIAVEPPAELPAPDGRTSIRLERFRLGSEIESYTNRYRSGRFCSGPAWDRFGGQVRLRSWRPGDRFNASSSESGRKVKELFHQARIPSWDRAGWPVLAASNGAREQLIWMRGFGVAREFQPGADDPSVVRLEEFDGQGRQISGIENWLASVSTSRGPSQASSVKGNLS